MADEQEHLKQAWHNTILGKELCEKNPIYYRDWVITISFYAALHFIEAWLSTTVLLSAVNYRNKNSIKGSIHKARKDLVKNKTDKKTYRSYQQLYTMSMQARYLMNNGQITAYDYFNQSDARRAVNEFLVDIILYFGFEDTQDEFAISDIIN